MSRIYEDLIEEIKEIMVCHSIYPVGEDIIRDLRDLLKRYDI